MIVGGGTIAATLINESLAQVGGAMKVGLQAFFVRPTDPVKTIEQVIELAAKARKEGSAGPRRTLLRLAIWRG